MDVRKLQKIAVAALEDIKAKDIEVINTRKLTSLFDRIVIASADSTRQVKALADNVQETFGLVPVEAMAAGLPYLRTTEASR